MKKLLLIFLSLTYVGCAEVTDTIGITKPKTDSKPAPSCYGKFYDPNEEVYKGGRGGKPVACQEDLNSCRYPLYLNVCSGGDEQIGYNVDGFGNIQYCSNSPCGVEDRKRDTYTYPNGIEVACGFSVPAYMHGVVTKRMETCLDKFGIFGEEIGLGDAFNYGSSRSYNSRGLSNHRRRRHNRSRHRGRW